MTKKIIIMLIALNACVVSGNCQISRKPHCSGADSTAILLIPFDKTSKSFASAKKAEETQDVVDIKYEWTKGWEKHIHNTGHSIIPMWYNEFTCEKQLIYADGRKEAAGSVSVSAKNGGSILINSSFASLLTRHF